MGSRLDSAALSRAATAQTMVTQLSHEKLPLKTSHSWVTMITRPAASEIGCGHARADQILRALGDASEARYRHGDDLTAQVPNRVV